MTNKKLAWLRLGIYTLISYAFLWIPVLIFDKDITKETAPLPFFVMLFVGFGPAFGNLLTRLITKEGFQETFLHFRFEKWKYYLSAPVVNVLLVSLGTLVGMFVLRDKLITPEESFTAFQITTALLSNVSVLPVFALYTLGEELGWRGYMMPRLEKLIGTVPSIIVGGIIWAVWHAPLFQYGYNFGTDYPFFPYLGIGLMCVYSTALNAVYTWLTKRTGTVYVSSIAHAANNLLGGVVAEIVFGFKSVVDSDSFTGNCIATITILLLSTYFMYLCCKKKEYDMP